MESMVKSKGMGSNKNKNSGSMSFFSASSVNALLLAGCLAATSVAYAETEIVDPAAAPATKSNSMFNSVGSAMDSTVDYLGFTHTRVDDLHLVYVGVGDTNALLHFYADVPTRFGHVYTKVGQFFGGKSIAGQVGFRMPYDYENAKNNDGFYFGAYAGHIENSTVGAAERKNRLGAALEMSYLFLNKTSLTAASVSIGGAQTDKNGEASQRKITPIIMFGLSWGYGLF